MANQTTDDCATLAQLDSILSGRMSDYYCNPCLADDATLRFLAAVDTVGPYLAAGRGVGSNTHWPLIFPTLHVCVYTYMYTRT